MSACSAKCLVKPLTSSSVSADVMASRPVQVTRRVMPWSDLAQCRPLALAYAHGVGAAWMELAARGRVHHVAYRAGDRRQVLGLRVEARDRVQQPDRIGMLRVAEDLALGAEFDQMRSVHHADRVAGMGDHPQI